MTYLRYGTTKTKKNMEREEDGMNVSVNRSKLLYIYKQADNSQKQALECVFGKELFAPFNTMDRIKTMDDAIKELGEEHPFVVNLTECEKNSVLREDKRLMAYQKLRIIITALNEGWTPNFTIDEKRWYPCFRLFTKGEYDRLEDEDKINCKSRPVCDLGGFSDAAYVYASNRTSYSYTFYGDMFAFKSRELAEYAGKQFLDVYVEYMY